MKHLLLIAVALALFSATAVRADLPPFPPPKPPAPPTTPATPPPEPTPTKPKPEVATTGCGLGVTAGVVLAGAWAIRSRRRLAPQS